ncbi:MAG: YbbR-like domain-containing protein [Winogradskyella sp.]
MQPILKFNLFNYLKKRNVKRFLLFFGIAFIFLIFSKLSTSYKQTIKLNVELVNVANDVVLQHDTLHTIDAFIETKGFTLLPFIFEDFNTITIDAKTDVTSRSGYYNFDVQKHRFLIEDQLGKSIKLLSLKPDTLMLHYSKMASKYVPIQLNKAINYASGFDVKGPFKLNTDSVKIVGSAIDVNKIEFIATDKLVLKDVKTAINKTIKLNTANYNKVKIYPETVTINATITRFTEGTIEVPVTIINKPNATTINYFPKTVMVSYYVDLESYNTIKPTDFSVECNYLEAKTNKTYFIPKITKKPKSVARVNLKQKRIDFIKL